MTVSISLSRRNWILLGGLTVVGGGTGIYAATDDDPSRTDRERVRTDTAPLRRRFTSIGQLSDPHWLGFNPNRHGRESVPEPDPQIRVVGIARLPAGRAAAVVGLTAYGFSPGVPEPAPKALEKFLPEHARWLTSPRYDRHITQAVYRGRFHFDPGTNSVYFDTVNPEFVPGVMDPTEPVEPPV
ncbi:hypothetical protein [Streptomyces sp. NBC_00467]|uniref:hypothetical protein n=1 Tax=Streptomyces sp. NBC_00467 TaxID=2975752 RepID=UPI002E173F37